MSKKRKKLSSSGIFSLIEIFVKLIRGASVAIVSLLSMLLKLVANLSGLVKQTIQKKKSNKAAIPTESIDTNFKLDDNKCFDNQNRLSKDKKDLIVGIGFVLLSIILIATDHAILGLLSFVIGGIQSTSNIVILANQNTKTNVEKTIKSVAAISGSILTLFVLLVVAIMLAPTSSDVPVTNSDITASSQIEKFSSTVSSVLLQESDTENNNNSKVEKENESKEESKTESKTESKVKEKNESSSMVESSSKDESKSSSKTESSSENISSSKTIEVNTLQTLFANLTSSMNRDDIDTYIYNNSLVKYSFAWDSAYYIGYEYSAIRERGRDREGEAVDINFDSEGNIKSAKYTFHTGFDTKYHLKYENGVFYYDTQKCNSGTEAMHKYLSSKNTTESKVESKQVSKPESKIESKTESKVQSAAPQQQLSAYEFYGNMDSMCYHIKNCQAAQKISGENRFTYTVNAYSRYDAEPVARQYFESQGYHLCGICGK